MSNNKNINAQGSTSIELQEDIKNLVLARIIASSDDLRIAIGSIEYKKK